MKTELVTPNGNVVPTVDETVIEALIEKRDVQEEFFALLERIKGRVARRRKSKKTVIWDDEDD
jgi:hypothetical protein